MSITPAPPAAVRQKEGERDVFIPSTPLLLDATHAACRRRLESRGRLAQLVQFAPRPSLRRLVGRSLVKVGARLAAEPTPQAARP